MISSKHNTSIRQFVTSIFLAVFGLTSTVSLFPVWPKIETTIPFLKPEKKTTFRRREKFKNQKELFLPIRVRRFQ